MTSLEPTQSVLNVRNLHASYGPIKVLKGVSLEVRRGEIVAIIGSNGAGKTSTLMCISGINQPSDGSIMFEGSEIRGRSSHDLVKEGLVQVPEGRKIFARMTVKENLLLGAYLRARDESLEKDLQRVYELFPILKKREWQAGGTLSGGEQQMLAIGRAIMSKPRMLLMDEPSMGVAPLLVLKIFETIVELNKQGLTVLLVEQNANLALKLAHRGYVLETGTIVLEDKAANLLSDPKVREAYLGD